MAAKDHPHRSAIGNVQTDDMGDNLAIVLASDFEPGCESEELDDSETWKQEAVDKTNRVLDAIHAIYEPQLAALNARVMELAWRLEPFAKDAAEWADTVPDDYRPRCTEPGSRTAHPGSETAFTVGDLRLARDALRAKGGE